jgi:alpha-galactosidase
MVARSISSKNLLKSVLLAIIVCAACTGKKTDFHSWTPTPPMGWDSWDCYGPTVTEAEVKANADYMASHLKSFGWEYIVVDIRWYVGNDKAHGYNETNPEYSIDSFGRFLPAINRFPSAAGGKGFKPLADYLHKKGLKFGIQIMRGVPAVAIKQHLPIKGTQLTANDIYSMEDNCRWLHDMYTIIPSQPGAQEYYNSIFELYASWGVDLVKVDDLTAPVYFRGEVEMIRKAIEKTDRKIVLSTSPGETPLNYAAHVQQHANTWRTVNDFWDKWPRLKEHFEVFERWNKWRSYGAYPDGDILPLGHIGIRAEIGDPRMTSFTRDEQYTLMTLWSIFKSPLMFGGNLPDNDPFTDSLITNKSVLYVLNKSVNNRQLFRNEKQAAWIAEDPADGSTFLAVFNIEDLDEMTESKAIWKSNVINRQRQSETFDIKINGDKKLYLAVSGIENIECDHGDWINPILYKGNDSISLTTLKWKKASTGWGQPGVNRSASGGDLIVEGKKYVSGLGVHANSIIEYDLPVGVTRFKAMTGLDKGAADQNIGATIKFMVFTQNPSGQVPPPSASIEIDLATLGLQQCKIQDLWTGKQLGLYKDTFSVNIRKHGAGLYKLTSIK